MRSYSFNQGYIGGKIGLGKCLEVATADPSPIKYAPSLL